eukprot:IDg12175t1
MMRSARQGTLHLDPAGGDLQTPYHPIPVQRNVIFSKRGMINVDHVGSGMRSNPTFSCRIYFTLPHLNQFSTLSQYLETELRHVLIYPVKVVLQYGFAPVGMDSSGMHWQLGPKTDVTAANPY